MKEKPTDVSGTDDGATLIVSDQHGPDEFVAFFEDDGETGYLYVSDRGTNQIVKHLQIYTDADALHVTAEDVRVLWSVDGSKAGVVIWGGMRGIIDLRQGKEGRAFVEKRSSSPINNAEWLSGFEW